MYRVFISHGLTVLRIIRKFRQTLCRCPGRGVPNSCPDFRDKILACPDFPDQKQACPDFRDHDDPSRLPRPKRSWRDHNIATHIWYVHTFATEKLRLDFRNRADTARPCGSGNGMTGATKPSQFQTLQTEMETARISRPRRRRGDQERNIRDRGGCDRDRSRLIKKFSGILRPRWLRRDSKSSGATGLVSAINKCTFKTFATVLETARLSRPRRRRRKFPDQHGDVATNKKIFRDFATEVVTARLKKQRRDRPSQRDQQVHFQDFRDRVGDGATFQTEAETARLSRTRRRRRDQESFHRDRSASGATFAFRVETAQLFRPRLRRRDQERNIRDRVGCGATLAIRVETALVQGGYGGNFLSLCLQMRDLGGVWFYLFAIFEWEHSRIDIGAKVDLNYVFVWRVFLLFLFLACLTFHTKNRHVQTFANRTWRFQTFAITMIRRDFATEAELARPKHRDSYLVCPDSRDQDLQFPDFRDPKLKRPRRIQRDPATQETAWPAWPNLAISWFSGPRCRRRDIPEQHG